MYIQARTVQRKLMQKNGSDFLLLYPGRVWSNSPSLHCLTRSTVLKLVRVNAGNRSNFVRFNAILMPKYDAFNATNVTYWCTFGINFNIRCKL